MTEDDTTPIKLADMIRKKIEEQKAANPDYVYEKPEPQERDYSQLLKGNDLEAGMSLFAYDLISLIHSGETANIFLARHSLMETQVVAKILKGAHVSDIDTVCRMQEEARTMARIDSPHVANTIDFGIAPSGHPFMILMPAEASSLEELLASDGQPSISRALQIIEQLAEILAYLHSIGITYSNLKPGHVLVKGADSDNITAILVDFSNALREDSVVPQAAVSLDGAPYMSPEQAGGQTVGVQSDLYSLACLSFQLLTGEKPFLEHSVADYQNAHSAKPPRSIENSNLPKEVYSVLHKALSKNPAHRHETVQAFAEDLKDKLRSTSLS